MNRYTVVQIFVLASASAAFADDGRLFDAIVQVESGGRADAIGDGGKARGYVQAWRSCWTDGTQALGVKWDYATGTKDLAKCRAVFFAYGKRYGAKTPEDFARAWNSGPNWRKKLSKTDGYWHKVKSEMERTRHGRPSTRPAAK